MTNAQVDETHIVKKPFIKEYFLFHLIYYHNKVVVVVDPFIFAFVIHYINVTRPWGLVTFIIRCL